MINGNATVLGDITLDEDGVKCAIKRAIVLEFKTEKDVRQAIKDGACTFTVFGSTTDKNESIKEITDFIYDLQNVVSEVQSAASRLDEISETVFTSTGTDSEEVFKSLIEKGFVPGAKFIVDLKPQGKEEWEIETYNYTDRVNLVFQNNKDNKRSCVSAVRTLERLHLFEKVGE